jgi:hypothetical protein
MAGTSVIDEVSEVIELPNYTHCQKQMLTATIDLGSTVMNKMRNYVQTTTSLYKDKAFHN